MPDAGTTALGRALHGFFSEDLPQVRGLSAIPCWPTATH